MGFPIYIGWKLALRDYREFKKGKRKLEEFIPQDLRIGDTHNFLKQGHKLYPIGEGINLVKTTGGNEQFPKPIAKIEIEEITLFISEGIKYTKGKYYVREVLNKKE